MSGTDGRGRRHRRGVVLAWIGAGCLVLAPATLPVAGAQFTAPTSDTGNSVAAADIAAPSAFSATQTCSVPAVTFRGATSNTSAGTGSLTLTTPANTQAGDILVAHVTNRYDGSSGISWSSGTWNAIGSRTTRGAGAGGITAAAYWKVATASELASVTFTLGGGNTSDMSGGLVAYGGVNPTTPVNAVTVATGSGANVTTPSVNTTVANTRLLHALTKRAEAQLPPTGTTGRWRVLSATDGGNQGSTMGDETVPGTGPTGSRTASGTASTEWIVHTFALQPAPPVPTASLSWTASPTTGATGYAVQRVVSGSVLRQWTVTPLSATSTADGPLTNGTSYTYRLWAYSGAWVSPTVTTTLTPSC